MSGTSVNCPLCNHATDHVLTTSLRRGNGAVFYCESCAHGFLVPENKIDSKKYYAEEYRSEYSHKATGGSTHAREIFDIYRKYQKDRLQLISPLLNKKTKLLEVGASAGQFLVNVKDQVAMAHAIELDPDCCQFLKSELKIDADSEFLRQSKFNEEKYDVVCSFQVMEHVESPVDFLKDLRQSLVPGGKAFVEVPNLKDPLLSVWNIEAYKTFFYHVAHLHYFTVESLKKVALDAGFSAAQIQLHFLQDYNLLNHLSWVTNKMPQATCDVGLSPVHLQGKNSDITNWLNQKMTELNEQYMQKLIQAQCTSNIMMVLQN